MAVSVWLLAALFSLAAAGEATKTNVLWINVDDLRPVGTTYGQNLTHTPNLDALARESVVFDRAYVQFAVCAPSRTSFMTGRRPDRTESFNFIDDFREVGQNWTSLPQYFKNNGYLTLGGGKTFHPGLPADYDEPYSWSPEEPYFGLEDDSCNETVSPVPPYDLQSDNICTVANASALWDHRMASRAIEWLDLARAMDRPFFFAVGMRRPHLPWIVPIEYYERFANVSIPALMQPTLPRDIHNIAWSAEAFNSATLGGVSYVNAGPFEPAFAPNVTAELTRGYYASVAWVDSQIGRVLDAIGLGEAIIVVHGDHGYAVGEKACWTKHTNFELSTRVPLMIHVPGCRAKRSPFVVEIVDLYKTLADLANLGLPAESSIQGKSLASLFADVPPSGANQWAAYSQYNRCPTLSEDDDAGINITSYHGACKYVAKEDIVYMGYSIRTLSWRYTAWMRYDGRRLQGNWHDCDRFTRFNLNRTMQPPPFCARELYAHPADEDLSDFGAFEMVNLAGDPAFAATRDNLHARLRAHFEGDY